MSFEDAFLGRLDARLSASRERAVIARAHAKAEGFLREHVIRTDDFKDLYGADDVRKDEEHVRMTRERIEKESSEEEREAKKLADILEVVIHEEIQRGQWLGSSARAIKTTPFDDIVNGIDEVVEFERFSNTSHMALSLDVTFGTGLRGKFERVRREIESGELARVKYFKSRGFRGEKTHLPRIIIGVERGTVIRLARLWLSPDGAEGEIRRDPVQVLFLKEAEEQLRAFGRYAEARGKKDAAEEYGRMHALVTPLLARKESALHVSPDLAKDRVYAAIRRQVQAFE